MILEWIDLLYDSLFFLIPNYLVLGIVLFFFYKFSKCFHLVAKQLLYNLGWVIIIICLLICIQWYYCRVYSFYSEVSEYGEYALSQRLFGPYWWAYWMPILFAFPVFVLNLFKSNRLKLWVIIVGFLVCGLHFYNEVLEYIIMSNCDFISSTWKVETIQEPNLPLAFLYGILKVAIGLFIISIPMLLKFIRKK